MSKTEETRLIESMLETYAPATICGQKINKMRPRYAAFEVPVLRGDITGGIVDCIHINEYFANQETRSICMATRWKKEGLRHYPISDVCCLGYSDSESVPETCSEHQCPYNISVNKGTPDILITAYEIKVTKSDFKSDHGHNFVGNCNYYVVPSALYSEIKDLVPEDVGVVLYLDGKNTKLLRRKKECVYHPMSDADQKWMLLSVMKRIQAKHDAQTDEYLKQIQDLKYRPSRRRRADLL